MAERSPKFTYISLFSNAGIGCYGFKKTGFECVATNEWLSDRLNIQKYNNKCKYESGYICADATQISTRERIYSEVEFWKKNEKISDIDVIIATPPCQGISVANHKKKNELNRNSLIVESLVITEQVQPKFFIFENVRGFLKTACKDTDGNLKSIRESIEFHLGNYNIIFEIINFSDYGNPSNRTRALVLGIRKDLVDVTPYDIFPDPEPAPTLRQSIGHFPVLNTMGQIDPVDIFHNFRPYPEHMVLWIENLKEGQSAFDQEEQTRKPHKVVDDEIIENTRKNGDKYTRCYWNKPGFCIHTRNDQLASQNTIHPEQNRVFSIREVMKLMSVPEDFHWSEQTLEQLNGLSFQEKRKFLKKSELNIRRTLGEAVPTVIFSKIANKIRQVIETPRLIDREIEKLIEQKKLNDLGNLIVYLKENLKELTFHELSKIAELANAGRLHNAAYYTSQDICYTVISDLPDFAGRDQVRILEPSVGTGNFLLLLLKKYQHVKSVILDLVDIDPDSIRILKILLRKLAIPPNVKINFLIRDFLDRETCRDNRYDLVIGNPPYKKVTGQKEKLASYKQGMFNQKTNNLFSFFLEKSLTLGDYVAMVLPKTLLSAPEYNRTRDLLARHSIEKICDYGERAFKIKIETISLIVRKVEQQLFRGKTTRTKIKSYIHNRIDYKDQDYITDSQFPYWLIYRDSFFDKVASGMTFNVFEAFRDRQITNKLLSDKGRYRVLKSRNIASNRVLDVPGYDCYIDDIEKLSVAKFMNRNNVVMIPNLTYNPRSCKLPRNCIADGSVALATMVNGNRFSKKDLAYYATEEFKQFYRISRNCSSRSMNIDSNSIFFFGLRENIKT